MKLTFVMGNAGYDVFELPDIEDPDMECFYTAYSDSTRLTIDNEIYQDLVEQIDILKDKDSIKVSKKELVIEDDPDSYDYGNFVERYSKSYEFPIIWENNATFYLILSESGAI